MFLYCTMVVLLFFLKKKLIYLILFFPIVAKSKDDTQYKKLVAFASPPSSTNHFPSPKNNSILQLAASKPTYLTIQHSSLSKSLSENLQMDESFQAENK